MELLNSSWLIHLIEGAGRTPGEKILSVYTIIDTWLKAPNVRESLLVVDKQPIEESNVLKAHLMALALQGKYRNPEAVIAQLVMLLQGGIAVEIQNPGLGALPSAQLAAKAVLQQSQPSLIVQLDSVITRSGYAASIIAVGIVSFHFWPGNSSLPNGSSWNSGEQSKIISLVDLELLDRASLLRRNMESGNCPTPNFFSIPKDQLSTYVGVIDSNIVYNNEVDNKKLASFLAWYEQNRGSECFSKTEDKQKLIVGMGV